jgi:selenocysteine-specific elongation factor
MVEDDIRALARGTFLKRAPIIRTSASTGHGLDALKTALLNAAPAPTETEAAPAPFRLAIDRAFVLEGRGTVVTGTVSSGEARIGDELELMPAAKSVRIRALHTHGHETDHITRAQRAAINLAGVHHEEVTRGHELCAPGLLTPTRRITARIHILPDAAHPLRHRARVRLHLGTREVIASVRLLQSLEIQPGAEAIAQLVCQEPIVCLPGQRLVLRSESPVTTIGGGRVLDAIARHVSRRDHTRHERIAQLDAGAMTREQAARAAALPQDQASILLDELKATGAIAHLNANLVADTQRLQDMTRSIERVLSTLHEAAPLEPRHQRSKLLQKLAYVEPPILDALCNHLLETGILSGDQEAVALASFKPALPPALLSEIPAIIERYRTSAYRPPSTEEIATDVGASPKEVTKLIDLLTSDGTLIHIGGGMRLHTDNETKLKRTIADLIRATPNGVTTSQIKDALDTTRKYAIPICEYLDRIRLTRRIGDLRVLVE